MAWPLVSPELQRSLDGTKEGVVLEALGLGKHTLSPPPISPHIFPYLPISRHISQAFRRRLEAEQTALGGGGYPAETEALLEDMIARGRLRGRGRPRARGRLSAPRGHDRKGRAAAP